MTEASPHKQRMRAWPLTLAAGCAFVVLVSLGVWQLQRLAWKEDLLARTEARMTADPVSLNQLLSAKAKGEDIAYRRVKVRGRYVHEAERFFYAPDPRLGSGFDVYTPFVLTGGQGLIVVNRGYVPEALQSPAARAKGQVAGVQEVVGVVRLPGRKGAFTPDNEPDTNLWFWRDYAAMTEGVGVPGARSGSGPALFVDAEAPAPGGWPRGGVGKPEISNRHFGYVLTWFGLAATLLAVYGAMMWSRYRN